MNFYNGAVKSHRLDLDTDDLSMLQLLEQSIEHPFFDQRFILRVNGVPVAKSLWQAAPFAAVLGHVQNRIENSKIGQADVAAFRGKQCSICRY